MVRIEKIEVTDKVARYMYFPEKSEESGIVALDRATGEWSAEKRLDEYDSAYISHALRRIEKFQRYGNFLEKDVVVWY